MSQHPPPPHSPGSPDTAAQHRRVARALRRGQLGQGGSLPAGQLAGADLRGLDLGAVDLCWADLRGADLTGCRLHGARLRGAWLRGARLVDVQGIDLDLERADLQDADLTGAVLDGAILLEANLAHAVLTRVRLVRADLRRADLVDADLRRATLDGADLEQAHLGGARLDGATWRRARVSEVDGLEPGQLQALLAAGAWQGMVAPEIAPVVDLVRRSVRPATHWIGGRALRLRSSSRRWLAQRIEDRSTRTERQRQEAEDSRARRIASLPGGPGADLSGQDLHGKHLEEVDWTAARLVGMRLDGAHLQRGRLDGADATEASLRGTRLAGASLRNLRAPRSRLVDADLRGADLAGADLSGADLTGADLREARLEGTILRGADLTAARLADVDLVDTDLRDAVLDQADLAGAVIEGASVQGADLRGALGLAPATRSALAEQGARTAEASIDALVKGIEPRHAAAALGVLLLGVGAYTATRLMAGGGGADPAMVAADEIRTLPPEEAMERFEELADDAVLAGDKVGYLLEASGQARLLGDDDAVRRLLREALVATGDDVELGAEVRLLLATTLADEGDHAEAMALVDPLLDLARQTTEQRARAILLYQSLADARGIDASARVDAVITALAELPDAAGELHIALAGLQANDGDIDAALAELDAAAQLAVTAGTELRILEARARTLDRAGRLDEAAAGWIELMEMSEADSVPHQAALLALADLRQRQGRTDEAMVLLEPLLGTGADKRLRARAHLVAARVHEGRGDVLAAAEAYRATVDLARTEPETAEEARLSLARVLGRGDPALLASVLAELGPEARAMVEVQARLGEARQALEAGRPSAARAIYEDLAANSSLDLMTLRDARTGLGEALAQEGDMAGALVVWRDLLSETARPEDRVHLELRIAQGLMRGGRLDEAEESYSALASSGDPDIAVQGRLGLAQISLALGEREKARALLQEVADSARDPAWKVRALEELADMWVQQGDEDQALAGWRAVLGAVPPGHAAASRARLAIVSALASANRVEEALAACDTAIAGAQTPEERFSVRITCAEVQERSGQLDQAHAAFLAILSDLGDGAPGASDQLPADAAAGAARTALALGRPQDALAAAERGLALGEEDRVRLSLLGIKTSALSALGREDEAEAVRVQRDELVKDAPTEAAGMLVEAAHEARGRGEVDDALRLMRQALDAQSDPGPKASVLVELGDMLLEEARLDEAAESYRQAAATVPGDNVVAFMSGMGLAEIERRAGQPAAAAARLAGLVAPDSRSQRWQAEARARALAEAGDADAPAAWDRLAALAGDDDDIRATALRGKADSLFSLDAYTNALPLYIQAAEVAPDPVLAGWARLGQAAALAALDRTAEAGVVLDGLRDHPDPEISLQAAIQRSQQAAAAEDWDTAVAAVQGLDAHDLGPAWDASLSQARAGALAGAGSLDAAAAELEALAARWPGEEEAQVPAWLARSELALRGGSEDEARGYAEKARDAAVDPGFKAQAEAMLASLDAG